MPVPDTRSHGTHDETPQSKRVASGNAFFGNQICGMFPVDGSGSVDTIVTASKLTKRYRAHTALDGVSFELHKGEIVGLLGLNGAGKSTTLSLLTGRLLPDEGSVSILGHDLSTDLRAAQACFGFLPEGAPLFEDLTVEAHLKTLAGLRIGISGDDVSSAIKRFNLENVRTKTIETLSKGYKRRTALAGAFLGNPEILFLDEPTDGLDPFQKDSVLESLASHRDEQTLLISTHSLEDVGAICDRIIVLSAGKKVFDDRTIALAARAPDGTLKTAFADLLETAGAQS